VGVHARGAPDRGEPLSTGPDIDWRARAEALERELAERSAQANEALADAQRRTYWLDRLHLDLNAVMARPAARRLVALLPLAREVYRSRFHVREYGKRMSGWRRSAREESAQDALRARELAGAGEGLAAAAASLAPGPERRTLVLAPGSAAQELRPLWPGLSTVAEGGGFELVVVDEASGGLAGAAPRLGHAGRVLLVTDQPAEAVVDRLPPGWAVLGRRGVSEDRDLYLLARV
jgi:hypothetical protein